MTHSIEIRSNAPLQALNVKVCMGCGYRTHVGLESECPGCRDAEGGRPLERIEQLEDTRGATIHDLRQRVHKLAQLVRVAPASQEFGAYREAVREYKNVASIVMTGLLTDVLTPQPIPDFGRVANAAAELYRKAHR